MHPVWEVNEHNCNMERLQDNLACDLNYPSWTKAAVHSITSCMILAMQLWACIENHV